MEMGVVVGSAAVTMALAMETAVEVRDIVRTNTRMDLGTSKGKGKGIMRSRRRFSFTVKVFVLKELQRHVVVWYICGMWPHMSTMLFRCAGEAYA
jgi:hypothetical protein